MNLIHLLQNRYTPLHITVEWDAIEVAELLIRHGADVHRADEVTTPPIALPLVYFNIITMYVLSSLFFIYMGT